MHHKALGVPGPRLAGRARIILACADSRTGNAGAAVQLGLATDTVRKWRTRFAGAGLDGLTDRDRPGRPKTELKLAGAERGQLTMSGTAPWTCSPH